MDALTRRQFDRAMLAKERTLAIRVGDYASRDIKEASFEYGYIKGDTYKPGGTCAGSGKITFTSIITTFNKLDILHPEIGLLVGNAYQWVKMGEYFINDIEIDRNRNTTTLELMDGMFKLNREYVTDLHFPAEVREVIQEICLKTGIELANDYFGISAMRYHVEQVPEGKKLSFRDMLSSMTQMIGMSCFFNREGKMEIRDLTESNITINADSYFLHGLTKSEIEYQIAGITCKTDKKSLTVGMKTGRSLELDNVFMTQSALNDLYYKLKNLTYYPYNLNYQGHLLLEVGQWVTIQTNKKETFKVPVLSQSFTFKGGLRGRISADSKAGNDTQYSYEGTITKQIKQQDGIEAKIQAQIEAADAAFDAEFKKRKKEIDDGIELAKAKAEEVKQELSDTINQRFDSFDNGPLKEAKRKAEEALKNAGASSSLAQEAKQIGLDSIAKLEAFKSQITTAQTALSGDLDALKQTVTSEVNQASEYRRTTTEALSRMTGQMNGFATKSEVKQDIDGLTQTFAKMQVGGRNYYRDSEKVRTSTRFFPFPLHPYLTQENVGETWTLSFDLKINEGGEIRPLHFYHYQTNRFGLKASADITPSKEWQRFTFTGPVIFPNDDPRYSRGEMALYDYGGNNNYSVRRIKLEKGTLATDWSPAPEDTDDLITEAKATFERTAQGLRTDLSAIQEYVNKDGQRQEALQRYTREESAKQATAVRELVAKDYVGKTTYQEDVKGINQKIEAVKTSSNKEIASQIASYRQSVDGKFTDISSQITTYKQDVGGQISGLSNRLTSSEQGTTTQISNLSNRINSNKQGTDNQISNLKTQVATNKDNTERQMGRISDQVSANKVNADSQFANVTNQLARKVETTDFQRVKETSQLYERILGNTENGIADKVARMAMTNQLFQVEVSKNEGLKTVQRQLAGSWSVQNINSAGDIISGINLGSNGQNRITGKATHITGETLIDNAVIKSAMIDKLKTANFEAGSVTTTILDAEAVTAEKVRFDDAFIRKMIANEAFINQLTSKRIFATKVESVVSSSTFLEAYQGRIGGFTIGRFDQGRGRWISGINQFSVGMGNGEGGSYNGENTAFWANWGYSWNYPGPNAWYVTTSGNMYCRNGADFHGKVDFSNRSTVNFYSQPSFSNGAVINGSLRVSGRITYSGGEWLYSPIYNKLWKDNSQGGEWLYLDRQGNSGRDWIEMNKRISDRRYKSNIQDSQVSGLDAINNLKTYSYRKEYDGKIEDIACGIMAQDVQKYAPEAFYENPDGAYSYRTFELVPYLIKAIQELNQKIEKMEKIIA